MREVRVEARRAGSPSTARPRRRRARRASRAAVRGCGWLAIGSSGLGVVYVSGRSRVPFPPTRTTAFTARRHGGFVVRCVGRASAPSALRGRRRRRPARSSRTASVRCGSRCCRARQVLGERRRVADGSRSSCPAAGTRCFTTSPFVELVVAGLPVRTGTSAASPTSAVPLCGGPLQGARLAVRALVAVLRALCRGNRSRVVRQLPPAVARSSCPTVAWLPGSSFDAAAPCG